jgi:ABC-type Mn2+/Zn2+ transport system permease subunit
MRDSWLWVELGPGVYFAALLLAVALTANRRGKVFKSAWMLAWPGGLAVYQTGVFLDSRWLVAVGIAVALTAPIIILAVGGTRWQRSS